VNTTVNKNRPAKNGNHKAVDAIIGPNFGEQMRAQLEGLAAKEIRPRNDKLPASKGAVLMDLFLLFESKMNPRQTFDGLEQLAASIKTAGGLLVPIVARPTGDAEDDRLEIADGARRFRALELLKAQGHELRALVDVRPLTDAQMAEVMMMADQRDTLKPLEQARGYANMLAAGYTYDTIATTLGVSKGTVIGRCKLLELGPVAMKLFEKGVLTTAIATPLGRYPVALQNEAIEELFSERNRESCGGGNTWRYEDRRTHQGEKMLNVGLAIAWLQERFTRSLKSTAFDQADDMLYVPEELWPLSQIHGQDGVTAPSCKECPKNSNNMPVEVAGENAHSRSRAGFCTLPPCFEAKWKLGLKKLRDEAKEKGEKVLNETQSRKALQTKDQYGFERHDPRYAKASEINHDDPKKRTWGALQTLANSNIEESEQIRTVVAISEDGKGTLVDKAEVLKVLGADPSLKCDWAKPKKEKASAAFNYQAQAQRENEKSKRREVIAREVLGKYVQVLREKGPTLPVMRILLDQVGQDEADLEHEAFGVKSSRELDTFIEKKATTNDLVALLYMRLAADAISYQHRGFAEETERSAKELKFDLKAAEKAAAVAAKAEDADQ
jgi:ParB/RepB/Spo0J family partition protein